MFQLSLSLSQLATKQYEKWIKLIKNLSSLVKFNKSQPLCRIAGFHLPSHQSVWLAFWESLFAVSCLQAELVNSGSIFRKYCPYASGALSFGVFAVALIGGRDPRCLLSAVIYLAPALGLTSMGISFAWSLQKAFTAHRSTDCFSVSSNFRNEFDIRCKVFEIRNFI